MIGPEWNQEKITIFLRWVIVITIFAGLFFFVSNNPGVLKETDNLLKLGIAALIGNMLLHMLFGRFNLEQYHYICWLYDVILVTLLVNFTGGGFFAHSGEVSFTGNAPNFFLFIFPLLVLNNSIGKPWYSGLGSAFLLNGIILYFLLNTPGARQFWSLFALIGIFNFALGTLFLFSEQWIVISETTEAKKKEREIEAAYQTLRKEVEARKRREEDLYDKTRKLTTVVQVSRALGSTFYLQDLFEIIIEKTREEMNSHISFIMLEKDGFLEMAHSVGVSDRTKEIFQCKVLPGQSVIADVMLTSESIRLNSRDHKNILVDFVGTDEKIKTLLVVPLKAPKEDKLLGVLGVANLLLGEEYSNEHEDFLSIFAIEAAMFIRQLKLKADLERSYFELIKALAQAIEAKDPYTSGHVQRVADYSVTLARSLKLPILEIQRIEKAAILHDIGKIATPESILNKPGKLTDEEFQIMKDHVVESRKMLSEITAGIDDQIRDYVSYHHERWDGKGYPTGLSGDNIPLGAQIIAVADTFDAMTSDRPYRKGFTYEEALSRLVDTAGTQFNPKVLQTFFKLMNFDESTGKVRIKISNDVEIEKEKEKVK